MLKDVLKNKLLLISSAALLVIPYYTWKRLFKKLQDDKIKYEREVLFYRRHNCVVMYSPKKGMRGWPPHVHRIKLGIKDDIDILLEPILYFINTAEKSVDIAMMILSSQSIIKALMDCCKRKVKIRILLNFEHVNNYMHYFRALKKEGASIQFYIDKTKLTSMMHYKYMLKDYSQTGGYVFMGSMNMTNNSLLNNFEDVVFTSNEYVVESVHENFEDCWSYVKEESKSDYNNLLLEQAKLL